MSRSGGLKSKNYVSEYLSKEEISELGLAENEEIIEIDSWGGTFKFGEIWQAADGRQFYHVHDGMASAVGWYESTIASDLARKSKKTV